MNKVIFFFLLILLSIKGFSQNQSQVDTSVNSTLKQNFNGADIVFGKVQNKPEFPGGHASWAAYLKKNINLTIPLINKAISGTYNVSIRFTVEKEGSLRNIGAETNCGYGMETEVIRCIKLSPKWNPAQTANKEIVSFATTQLVIFKIKGTDIEIEIR